MANTTYFNVNRHINPTNVCVYTYNCKFCSFAALPGEEHAWQMSHEDVYKHAADQGGNRVTEFHIVGGLHPDLPMSWYEEMLARPARALPERPPQGLHRDRDRLVRQAREDLDRGGADAACARPASDRSPAAAPRSSTPRCARSSATASSTRTSGSRSTAPPTGMGLKCNCTMLYGHVEKPEHKVDHLLRLRALQDETGGFNAFIPLAYHPENNYMGLKYHTTGIEDLRHIAAARLVLDNIPHIKAYWVMITPKLAQVALRFGADDLDGTVVEETIYHMAGAEHRAAAAAGAELERIVREAGFVPVERDTLYNPVTHHRRRWPAGTRRLLKPSGEAANVVHPTWRSTARSGWARPLWSRCSRVASRA